MPYKAAKPEDRFWAKVKKTNGCWLWSGAISKNGYGTFFLRRHGKRNLYTYAHRFSYEIGVDKIPEGKKVLHSCDCRNCVNPKHFFLGTTLDNAADMVAKKRHRYGESSPNSKLTTEEALEIRDSFKQGSRNKDLAEKFSVSKSQVSRISHGTRWHHLEEVTGG